MPSPEFLIPIRLRNREITPDFDDTKFVSPGPCKVYPLKKQKIPDLPIVALGEDTVTLNVAPASSPLPEPKIVMEKDDWHRWNDYGIGLLLQGDLKAAQAAFVKATEADPNNPDGWVNIGRAAVQEGDMDHARTVMQKALALSPNLARAHYVYSRVLLSDGRYDDTAAELGKVLAQYPYDRVVFNDLGHVLFLQRKYADAVQALKSRAGD